MDKPPLTPEDVLKEIEQLQAQLDKATKQARELQRRLLERKVMRDTELEHPRTNDKMTPSG